MLSSLCFLALILGYFYSIRKTKGLLRGRNLSLNLPQKRYSFLLLALYSIVIFLGLLVIGHLLSVQVIKYYLVTYSIIHDTHPLELLSITQTLDNLPKLLEAHPSLTGLGQISFYLSNQDLLNLYKYYHHVKLIADISLFVILFIIGMLILNKLVKQAARRRRFQDRFESWVRLCLLGSTGITIFVSAAIVTSLLWESVMFFHSTPIFNFLLGTQWTPQNSTADPSHSFGIMPLLSGTFLIAIIAVAVAILIAIPAAVYMSEFMPSRLKDIVKPLLEVLSGVPTIVYGFFAALVLGPLMVSIAHKLGFSISSESAAVAGLIIGIMVVPFISSATDDVLTAMPPSIREGAYALGCMPYEVILKVLLPAAFPGILSSVLLAFSRAIGETMVVVMASGLFARLTLNPFDSVTTITTQIVVTVQGDQDFGSIKTLSLFALGFTLFCVTLILNLISFWVVKRYRKQW